MGLYGECVLIRSDKIAWILAVAPPHQQFNPRMELICSYPAHRPRAVGAPCATSAMHGTQQRKAYAVAN